MIKRCSMIATVAALGLCAANSSAQTTLFANMTNSQEVPPAVPTLSTGGSRPASFGTATLVLSADQQSLTMNIEVFNIDFTGSQTPDTNDNLSAAHIHAGPGVTPTTTAGVVFGFIGTPFNDNNPNDVIVTPFASGVGGTVFSKWDAPEGNNTTLAAQIDHLLNERAYLNFHTTQFPGGEIRGVIFIPEPSALALLSIAPLLSLRRRTR